MERTRLEIADGIAWITLDDGKVNAMSIEMLGEIDARLSRALAADAVAVLIGREGIFSAGFDMPTFQHGREAVLRMVGAGARLVERLLAHPLPIVTVCTGHAFPMGAFLMLCADVRFGISGPYRIGMNETAIGLTVPSFAIELARHRLTPPGFARIATAGLFAPEEARALGYLDEVVAPDQLHTRARAEAERLCTLDRPSYAATKARINGCALAAVRTAIEAELKASEDSRA